MCVLEKVRRERLVAAEENDNARGRGEADERRLRRAAQRCGDGVASTSASIVCCQNAHVLIVCASSDVLPIGSVERIDADSQGKRTARRRRSGRDREQQWPYAVAGHRCRSRSDSGSPSIRSSVRAAAHPSSLPLIASTRGRLSLFCCCCCFAAVWSHSGQSARQTDGHSGVTNGSGGRWEG